MTEPTGYSRQSRDLTVGWAHHVVDHPEVDDRLPRHSYIFFEIVGDEEFNAYSRECAARYKLEPGYRPVCVRVDGFVRSAKGIRLVNPVIKVVKKPTRPKAGSAARRTPAVTMAGRKRKSA